MRAGVPPGEPGAPLLPGPVLAAPYHLPARQDELTYGYGRSENLTWTAFVAATIVGTPAQGDAPGAGNDLACGGPGQ